MAGAPTLATMLMAAPSASRSGSKKERWQRGVQCIAWRRRDGEAGDLDPAGGANGGAGVNGIQSQPTNQRLPEASSDGRAEQPRQAGDDQLVAESEHRPQGSINSHGAGDPRHGPGHRFVFEALVASLQQERRASGRDTLREGGAERVYSWFNSMHPDSAAPGS